MSGAAEARQRLRWEPLTRPDGVRIEQALARNNSWYMIVPAGEGAWQLRYASQSGNFEILTTRDVDDAERAAEHHADRYDTRV